MGFDIFENTKGNTLPNTSNNLKLIQSYNNLKDYTLKMKFWDSYGCLFNCYYIEGMNEDYRLPEIADYKISIIPVGREEWILYYKWQRDKALEQKKIEFINTINNFTAISQKVEYKDFRLNDIEQKLKILNPNANDHRRHAKYAYDCEVKGEIPYREHCGVQTDSGIIQGGVLYGLKHFISNYEFTNGNDSGGIVKTITNFRKNNYTAKLYCLTYIIECYAKGEQPVLPNNKVALELIGSKISNGKIAGNTFYKNYSETISIELDKKLKIEDNFGFDWKDKILDITTIPDKVKTYFESHNL